ncbi:unnamed protein product [Parajaminaea phylloscopi]
MLRPTSIRIRVLALCRLVATLALVVALTCSAAPTSPSAASHPDLVQLTSQNWTTEIQHGSWLIEFYSPYCSHCKAFLPLWKELSQNKAYLASDVPDAPFRMAQVNCFAQSQLCVDQEVPHFPKLTIYRDGKRSSIEYQGDREYTELAKWIESQAREYRIAKGSSNGPQPVHALSAPSDHRKPSDTVIGNTNSQETLNAAHKDVQRPVESNQAPVASAKPAKSTETIEAAPMPVIQPPPAPEFVDDNLPNPRGVLLQYGITPGLQSLQDLYRWLGMDVPPSDNGTSVHSAQAKGHSGVTMTENSDEGNVGTGSTQRGGGNGGAHLVNGHSQGRLGSYDEDTAIATRPSPGSPMRTRLPLRKDTVAKGGTFVKFYAPWCPHCKAMAKAFADLAPALKNRLNILEVDCQANLAVCRAFAVTGYPTLRLYSPTNKLVSEYRGSRSFSAMRSWCEKAAEEEGVDLPIANDEGHWAEVSRREEVRFLWLTDGSDLDVDRGVVVASWEEERDLVTSASKGLFTSPFRVYRTSHGALASRFQNWFGKRHGGYKSVLLAFKDHKADRPVAAFHISPTPLDDGDPRATPSGLADWRTSERNRMASWLDANRYPTISQVGGDSWTDVVNNRHGAPVVLALLSDEHHDGETYATGSGSARREAEIAALKRMALAWRHNKRKFAGHTEPAPARLGGDVLWGWIDADRWRKAIASYYSLRRPVDFPALILVDGPSLTWYPLPTLRPSELIDAAQIDSPTGRLSKAASAAKAQDYGFATDYAGASLQISTWLGRGAASTGTLTSDEDSDPVLAGATQTSSGASQDGVFVDDLRLLDEIEAIGRGERRGAARSSRSYLDRGYRRLGNFVSWGASHPTTSTVFLFALLAALVAYVKRAQAVRADIGRGLHSADTESGEAGALNEKRKNSAWWERGHSSGTKVD